MIKNLLIRYDLWKNPPYKGDVYFGSSYDFMVTVSLEHRLYRLYDQSGYERLWYPIYSEDTIKLTIESDSQPYYRCTAEILCYSAKDPNKKEWLRRVQPKRIRKEEFHQMILDGRLKKT